MFNAPEESGSDNFFYAEDGSVINTGCARSDDFSLRCLIAAKAGAYVFTGTEEEAESKAEEILEKAKKITYEEASIEVVPVELHITL